MKLNAFWKGREYDSRENCTVIETEDGWKIESVIVGEYKEMLYQVEYMIRTNREWETREVQLRYRHSTGEAHWSLESDGEGHWKLNGKVAPEFENCIDVDIPLTPFTNTLPIRRLNMHLQEDRIVQVICMNVLAQKINVVQQKYMRLDEKLFHYENVPNDIEADIIVDDDGLVIDYPVLFERSALQKSELV